MQLSGQPVEQFGVRGTTTHEAEIAGRVDDARAKVIVPQTIGQHARRQRILRATIHSANCQPPFAFGGIVDRLLAVATRLKAPTGGRGDLFAFPLRITTQEDVKRPFLRAESSDPPSRSGGIDANCCLTCDNSLCRRCSSCCCSEEMVRSTSRLRSQRISDGLAVCELATSCHSFPSSDTSRRYSPTNLAMW